ncbi:hypothetical protein RSOLAG1IB_00787 [Rhizoctonia solani AG-1 IB]|uniref:MIT domain-containing protein n=1 Tax=Thanatephorus cucumeris (strain AG1-IB / isolate 7/3/14) TaxID=1108050 RepID=A0A0B7F7N5_THACB|nr:hypothetical protein RSOLAG1IB_00787 [Rhizoctonia solani AG-1 IB]
MSFKTLYRTIYAIFVVVLYNVIGKISKYNVILYRCILTSESRVDVEGSKYEVKCHEEHIYKDERCPQVNTDPKTLEIEQSSPSTKITGSLNIHKGSEKPPCRRKLDAALPILLRAIELDNAGSLEAVGAYREAVRLFDDAIGILEAMSQRPSTKRDTVEASLRDLHDTYSDRADFILRDFQMRVLNRRF